VVRYSRRMDGLVILEIGSTLNVVEGSHPPIWILLSAYFGEEYTENGNHVRHHVVQFSSKFEHYHRQGD